MGLNFSNRIKGLMSIQCNTYLTVKLHSFSYSLCLIALVIIAFYRRNKLNILFQNVQCSQMSGGKIKLRTIKHSY